MKIILILFIAILAIGCGPMHYSPPIKGTNNLFDAYIGYFEGSYDYAVTTDIQFAVLGNGVNAKCWRQGNARWIEVNINKWAALSELRKLGLIYHELIHCEFRVRPHIGTKHTDNCPTNIMYSSLPSDYCLDRYWDSYVSYWQ